MFIDRIINALASSLLIGCTVAVALLAMPAPARAADIGWRQTTALERESAGTYTRRGTATFDAGDVATVVIDGTNRPRDSHGRLPFKARAVYRFNDGSGFTIQFAGSRDPASGAQDGAGKFVSGTGRYQRIMGKFTFTGRIAETGPGETEYVGSYSLPKK